MHASRTAMSTLLALPLAIAASAYAPIAGAERTSPDRSPPTRGSFIRVTNCNDSGPGSLRAAVAVADSGDYINMRALRCSRIPLTSGAIGIPQDDLTLQGPARELTIDGNQADRVLEHSGAGTLRLRNLAVANGFYEGEAATGGCIDSAGDLRLDNVRVHHCRVSGGGGGLAGNDIAVYDSDIFSNTAAGGGGIAATGQLTLVRSSVSGNTAYNSAGGFHTTGGLYAYGSEISNNTADMEGAFYALGDEVIVTHSLISGNHSHLWINAGLSGPSVLVANTTVSGNTAGGIFSGLLLDGWEEVSMVNSTVTHNVEMRQTMDRECAGAVVALVGLSPLHMESSIVAGNSCDGDSLDIVSGGTIIGSDNLVRVSRYVTLPPDTISADPLLLPLADNGGYTRTHALQSGSPAIDMGNNAAGFEHDQRGPGFPRVNGGRADIGAYER